MRFAFNYFVIRNEIELNTKSTIMAEENEAQKAQEQKAEGTIKTPVNEAKAAPEGDKAVEQGASDAPTGEDITNVVMLLNEFNKIAGGEGEITEIPEQLRGVLQFVIGKMVALRDAYYDPLFKAILDDLVDQQEDGQTPSVKVAIARTVPVAELQELADSEEYAGVQQGLGEAKTNEEAEAVSDEELYGKFEQSQANIEAYCEKMGYDDAEKEEFYGVINMWRDVFADGLISDADCERIDKERNYDKDMSSLKAQIPKEPTKEIVPDKSSIDATMTQKVQPKSNSGSVSAMQMAGQSTDYQNVGKRKIFNK